MYFTKHILIVLCAVSYTYGKETAEKAVAFSPSCESKCKETYFEVESHFKGCNSGCRLLATMDRIIPTNLVATDLNETVDQCERNCDSAYSDTKEDVAACQNGCTFMVPFVQERRKNLRSPLEDFFRGPGIFRQVHLPQIFIRPRVIHIENEVAERKDEDVPEDLQAIHHGQFSVRNLFERMNNIMKWTMEKIHSKFPEGMGTGKMVVIKSGPGFQETKTYSIGPGFKMNDMMSQSNPLDNFFNSEDFEQVAESSNEEKKVPEVHTDDSEFNRNLFDVELFDPTNNNLHPLDEPHLPEPGLKTRFIVRQCSEHNPDMKWADWMSCLHQRIGMPRWLTAATLSLGIIFALWLCLTIPQNAPRQHIITRAPLTKAALAAEAKAAEAMSTVISIVPVKEGHMDLPPAYEEVTNLKVALAPLHNMEPKKDSNA